MGAATAGSSIALVTGPSERPARAVLVDESDARAVLWSGPLADLPGQVASREASGPVRWVVWSARELAGVVESGVHVHRVHDVAQAHRLLRGGLRADPGYVWAHHRGIDPTGVPPRPSYDLFDTTGGGGDDLIRPDGHLRPDAVHGDWLASNTHLHDWARALLEVASAQRDRSITIGPRLATTIRSESAAAVLCLELESRGLPIDRPRMIELIARFAGPRADTEQAELEARRSRDAAVLQHAPGWEGTDLRNPMRVKELLSGNGIDVPNTRKWVLEAYRESHPLVAALLEWRTAERIATTYGYRWLDAHVGTDDRLRGHWSACDGAAGRMTADNGLHNLPAQLRDGVAAQAGHLFVRADLGQVEPRVLAVVSQDEAFAAATQAEDLYAPVATRLRVERPVAKVAVLAAMYGQRSGAAGEALRGLEAAYPVAMGFLDRAYAVGVAGGDLRTFGGRLIRTGGLLPEGGDGVNPQLDAARGRFARNAVIQGAAAELFKAWAATVRATTEGMGVEIVLCLHDELLLHVPRELAASVAERVQRSLVDAARRWSGADRVRFVADVSIIERWSQAKE